MLPGSVFGGALLVAGCCIGAGMLALPILTGLAGFFPAIMILAVCWAFMLYTGLLLVECSGWFYNQVNLISMTDASLGAAGRWTSWISYLLLFYSLLVAYIAASGAIFAAILQQTIGLSIPETAASIFFTFLFGSIIYLGTRPVDLLNRVLMFGLIATYLGLIGFGLFRIEAKLLVHWAPASTFAALPVVIVSFGFQNMIPSLAAYMKGDLRRVRHALFGGSLLALVIYALWILLVLGVVPIGQIRESYRMGHEATEALTAVLGHSSISRFAQGFAFFAVVTSFLTMGLSLTHFLADGFKVKAEEKGGKLLTLATILPPLIFALTRPGLFYKALSFAGGICAMILFGILPVAMIWRGRYQKKLTSNYHAGGGKITLMITLAFAIFVILCELVRIF